MENNYGSCKFCNAKMVKSPKTGKVFCSEKCWLKNLPNAPETPIRESIGKPMPNYSRSTTGQIVNPTDPLKILSDEIVGLRTEVREMIQIMRDQTGM